MSDIRGSDRRLDEERAVDQMQAHRLAEDALIVLLERFCYTEESVHRVAKTALRRWKNGRSA